MKTRRLGPLTISTAHYDAGGRAGPRAHKVYIYWQKATSNHHRYFAVEFTTVAPWVRQ